MWPVSTKEHWSRESVKMAPSLYYLAMETAARKCVGCILAKGDRRSKIMVLTALPLDPPTNQLVSDLDEAALHSPVSETINLPVNKSKL